MLIEMADLHLASADATTIAASGPRPCGVVEGAKFLVLSPSGRSLRCVITASALQSHHGADSASPASWMAAFLRHRPDIERRDVATMFMSCSSTMRQEG